MKPNEPRKYPRFELKGRVFVHDQEHIYIAPLNNVSRGGVFIDKLVSLEPGHRVKLVIKSSELNSPLQATGVIVRVENQSRMGSAIEFDWIDKTAFDQISAEKA